ncbi:hypothetical protein [Streptomyces alanosinicus]|uniref:Uncharacterized protein n=1 Tax=Streptomyces alanosinicus TaxID=68171 RepID=A0A919D5V7_9ACTN|nr:hypothetical protein [Streptomyces alanosinicus]GHE09587.1 hypothetical protein GCM10010339_62400 [Streptomyces alanosinicus]
MTPSVRVCASISGAASRSRRPNIDGDYIRDEDEQARYLRRQWGVFDEEGVDTAFWFTFAGYTPPHHEDPRYDLDMASYGVRKVMPDGSLAPKRSFHAMAEAYRSAQDAQGAGPKGDDAFEFPTSSLSRAERPRAGEPRGGSPARAP